MNYTVVTNDYIVITNTLRSLTKHNQPMYNKTTEQMCTRQ